jgi:hypothetical protein
LKAKKKIAGQREVPESGMGYGKIQHTFKHSLLIQDG